MKGVKTPVQRGIRVLAPFTAARLAEHRPLVPRRLCRLSRGERQLLERPVNPALLAREGLHDLRIELASRRAQDLVDRALPAERRAIGPVACHCIECVGEGEDPRSERNGVRFEAVGIAAAVSPFVVMPDHVLTSSLQNSHVCEDVGAERPDTSC